MIGRQLPPAHTRPTTTSGADVAATRAKDRLILTHVRTRGGRDTAAPSRFLYEAGLLSRPARQAA
jgi:superfamily I DNA/RNA helicase